MSKEIKFEEIPKDECLLYYRWEQKFEEILASANLVPEGTKNSTEIKETLNIFCYLCGKYALKVRVTQYVSSTGIIERAIERDSEPVRDKNLNIICTNPD